MFFYPSSSSSKPSSSSFDPSVRLRPNGTLSSTSTGVVGTHQTYHRDPVLVARRSRRRHDDDDVNPDASPFVGDERRRRRRPIFDVGSSRVRFDVRLRHHHRARPPRRAAHPSISNVGVDDTDDDHPRSHFVVVVAIVISPVVGVVHPQKHLETDFVSVVVVVVSRRPYRRRRPDDDDDVYATTTVISTGADAIRRRRHLASYRVVTRRRMKDEFLENQ